ncbi:glycosyltransferase family 2 protein [Colwellia echini]|uniref:Glycosyltransferase family 2 protein n=1 Tax=Colwellia echini TaxID=1982103 RepID=A0ABY3MXE7_9GAMM|nr:glycosyltransferase family 2 protein [Colwellia echini]TYK65757.1 glycosyltransferase family 2 protein [Colwellia echini]
MTTFILITTLISLLLIVHVYIGYPVVLKILTLITPKRKVLIDEDFIPEVSLLISCYNEVDVLEEKIQNSLAIDYPKEKLTIIIISDGSDDGTDDIAKNHESDGIKLIRQEGRLGKTSAINLAMETVTSEIVVFSDANAMYEPDAIKKLVRNFVDERVGYVVGAALYTDGKTSSAAASEDIYWKYELALKTMESNLHSVVGGDGAIYAIRKNLFITLDAKDINDFVNPLQIIEQGYRGVFEPQAICLEETAGDFSKEAKRKQRIVNRSFRGLMKVKAVLNPFKFGFFSFEVISHKLLRWLMPVFIVLFAVGSIYLGYQQFELFKTTSVLGILFLWLAQIGFLKAEQTSISKIFFIPYYFLMVNYYSLMGVITALAGNIQVTWSSPRTDVESASKLTTNLVLGLIAINAVLFKIFTDLLL